MLLPSALIVTVYPLSPLREHRDWVERLCEQLGRSELSLHQVDSHNIVPVWETSEKQEYAARTIRPKVTKKLAEFLTEFPAVAAHPVAGAAKARPDWEAAYRSLAVDRAGWGVGPVHFTPGSSAALANLHQFVEQRLKQYGSSRNDPNVAALSDLSPWVNMGQLSMQRAVLYVKKRGKKYSESVSSFIEEAVGEAQADRANSLISIVCSVRRELSDNFCYYNKNYDSVAGATDWAQKTLKDHSGDKREYVYTREQLERGETHGEVISQPSFLQLSNCLQTICGTLPSCNWCMKASCTASSGCTGPRRCWSGPRPLRKRWPRRSG